MNQKRKKISDVLRDNTSAPAIKSPVFQKWAVAVAVSSIIALLFSTNISLISRSYKAGDIAVMDVTASRDLVEQGIDIKKGEIVIRAGDRITEDAVKKLKVVAESKRNIRV